MIKKKCSKCGEEKLTSSFFKSKVYKSGLACSCIECAHIYMNKYQHSKAGVSKNMYHCQRANSKPRGDVPPSYTRLEFNEWLNNQPNFDELYLNWINSGYNIYKKPSCERLDAYKQ